MQIKVYQANIYYKDYTIQTPLVESLETLKELLNKHKNYLFYERFKITINVDDKGIVKSVLDIKYNSLDMD